MGHQKPTPLIPLSERRGCRKHDAFDVNCFECYLNAGGSDD